ncbi:hypothetical protein ASPZODRAFT_136370 [Penicilliopsis zonata CBS 506.65]|uniref:FAD-binding domain-containing protein n=1 Tax=Penicilliopsis zonata CBS 506.65 TaxID=1073090 RepID=A0A1L9S7P4_9EURO|nr:hypothetical protein ASPZODRAFT_136370 [Penicilliopsis zonata CBS 506.65]OJJ43185.1 hypothetical protein ASPZODRAFT_136370 [Penicilliopsis zonata CBS 506.65]
MPLDILIVGAGIAGLSAAIALGKQGHRIVILEKSQFATEVGAAIHIPPNCTAVLEWMGINPADFGGTLLREIHRYDSKGNVTYLKDFTPIRGHWQAEWYLVHRVDLHSHLKEHALKTATLHTGCRIEEIDYTSPRVVLSDGRVFTADLLLGADGVHSQVRTYVSPSTPAATPAGKVCFRWLLPTSQLKEHPSTAELVARPGVFIEWEGPDRRLVAYPCSNDQVYNLCAFVDDDGTTEGQDIKPVLCSSLSGFPEAVQRITESAENPQAWTLRQLPALPDWVRGRAVLLGDAAHPFQPYLGQGGAMAIEDAVSLAVLLPAETTVEQIPDRLKLYDTGRRPRVDLVMEYTLLNGQDEGKRVDAAGMVKFMGICFSHNEVKASQTLLQTVAA